MSQELVCEGNASIDREAQEFAPLITGADDSDGVASDAFVKSHPLGTAFHLMAWQRMIRDSFNYTPKHILARDEQGNICGVLPLFLIRSVVFGRMLVSTPQAAYGS